MGAMATVVIMSEAVLWYTLVGLVSCMLLQLQMIVARSLRRLPPGPIGLPIVGNLLQIGSKPNESLQRLSAKYGPIMTLILGRKTLIVASSPEMASQIYKTHDKDVAGRDPGQASRALDHHKRALIFGQPEQHWRMLRRISNTQLFSAKKLQSLHHLRSAQVRLTMAEIHRNAKASACVNLRDTLLRCTINLLGKMAFGRDMFAPDSADFRDFQHDLHELTLYGVRQNVADFFPLLRWFDPQHVARGARIYREKVYANFDRIIQQRLVQRQVADADKHAAHDLLDTLLDDSGPEFSLADITAYFHDMFVAGTDTTMITTEWAMAELICNPVVMKKLQAEMDEVIGRERMVEEADMDRLPYLQAVVKETLRLHPAAPLLVPHRAIKSCEIGGFVVPKDARIVINYWAIARDPKFWEEPLQFKPERFEKNSGIDFRGQNFAFIPFGGGRRICLGLPLANIIIHALVGAMIQSFNWSPPPGKSVHDIDMDDKFGITMHKITPLEALPSPRLPSHVYRVISGLFWYSLSDHTSPFNYRAS